MVSDTQESPKSRPDRKTVLVGLIIGLLFIGGGIYAWQGSVLKNSIGKAVQPEIHSPTPQPAAEKDENSYIPEASNQQAAVAPPVVQRQTQEVVRAPKQTIQVIFPNGGETFCMGEVFNIFWTSEKTEPVHVALQSGNSVYALGDVPAGGTLPQQNVSLPPAGTTYKVVVSSISQKAVQDSSDSFFAIRQCTE